MTKHNEVILYGNLGGDPELKTIPGKEVTTNVYDAIIDDPVEKTFTTKDREVRNFSVAVSKKNEAGEQVTRWIRCIDWSGCSKLLRKGDRVKLNGYFKEPRTYETKAGETVTVKDFVVLKAHAEKMKVREQAE